jgi:flagellar biosynthesis component FlhA
VSLVSLQILLLFLLPFLLHLIVLLPFSGVAGLPNHPTSGLEDAAGRAARRLPTEKKKKKKKKKHADKKRSNQKREAHNALEKRPNVLERDGLPLEPSPST